MTFKTCRIWYQKYVKRGLREKVENWGAFHFLTTILVQIYETFNLQNLGCRPAFSALIQSFPVVSLVPDLQTSYIF